ncbi:MAG: hypothetical protein ACXWL5_00475 [Candidatus Chromulinivorax sp.]
MKKIKITFIQCIILLVSFFGNIDCSSEKNKVENSIQILSEQNQKILDLLKKNIPSDKIITHFPVLEKLEDSCRRSDENLKEISSSLNDNGNLSDNLLPRYDILKNSSFNLVQIEEDVKNITQNNYQLNDLEQALYPWRKVLPSKIYPWRITALCTSIPLFFSVACVLASDDKNFKREMVMGLFKTGFVGIGTALTTNYFAKIWNPIRIKLDAGTSQEINERLSFITSKIQNMNASSANYLALLQNAQASNKSLDMAYQGKIAADRAALQSTKACERIENLSSKQDESNQRLNLIENRLQKLQKAAEQINSELKKQGNSIQITANDLRNYFENDLKDKKYFDTKFGELQGAIVFSILQNQDILQYTKAIYAGQSTKKLITDDSSSQFLQKNFGQVPLNTINNLKIRNDKKLISDWVKEHRSYVVLPSQVQSNTFYLKRTVSTKILTPQQAPQDIQNSAASIITKKIKSLDKSIL